MARVKEEKPTFMDDVTYKGTVYMLAKTFAAPLERCKLLLQNQDLMLKLGRLDRPYLGIHDCAQRIIEEEGHHQLWRGNLANCFYQFPDTVMKLAFESMIKSHFKGYGQQGYWTRLAWRYAMCVLPPLISLCVLYPLNMARTRLACDTKSVNGKYQFKGMTDVFKKAFAYDGIIGLYRGFLTTCMEVMSYNGWWFAIYELAKELTDGKESLLLGFAATVLAAIISYPLDTVSSRITATCEERIQLTGTWLLDYTFAILKNHGIGSFFKGLKADMYAVVVYSCTIGALGTFKRIQAVRYSYVPKL